MTERMIPCSQAVQQLWDYLDQALSAEEQERLEGHLSFCRRCCGELEFAKELQVLLGTQEAEEIPPEVKQRMESFVEEFTAEQDNGKD